MMTFFTILISLQLLLITVHDWLHIPGWTHGHQAQAVLGPRKMWLGTLFHLALAGPAVGFAIYYWHRPKPLAVLCYWVIYCVFIVIGAIAGWWMLYLRGADQKTTDLYSKLYAGTRQIQPPRGDNPRPNLLHLHFHALFVVNLALAVLLLVRRR